VPLVARVPNSCQTRKEVQSGPKTCIFLSPICGTVATIRRGAVPWRLPAGGMSRSHAASFRQAALTLADVHRDCGRRLTVQEIVRLGGL
jgi:hypothetical protein